MSSAVIISCNNSGDGELSINNDDSDNKTPKSDFGELIIDTQDVTITKIEQPEVANLKSAVISSNVAVKPQVLPLVYVNKNKTNISTSSASTVSSFQFTPIESTIKTLSVSTAPSNKSVILAPVPTKSSLFIQKPKVVPIAQKTTQIGNYLTMLNTTLEPSPKYVVPPKMSSRPAITATTNSVQPKITFMPLTIKTQSTTKPEKKFFNIKISEGKLEEEEEPNKSYELSISEDQVFAPKKSISIYRNILPKVEPSKPPTLGTAAKKERRRKSHFSYRKGFNDDLTVVEELPFKKQKLEASKTDNNNIDFQNILSWSNDGFGTLPGTNLKFMINEFNLVEYVTQEEYHKLVQTKMPPKKSESPSSEMRCCVACGCFGMPSEFVTPKHCSFDCQTAAKNLKKKALAIKKPPIKDPIIPKKETTVIEIKSEKDSGSEDEHHNTSNENSRDKFTYPWECKKKGFSWSKYLGHINAKSAPVKLFKDPFPYNRNGFKAGMKLEGVDHQHPSCFCVLTVAEVQGYRLRLHFDGYPDNYDFWINADSHEIFPMGWCEKYGHTLLPPPGYKIESFNWLSYLKDTKSTAAPKHLFVNRTGNNICPNGFRVGMKLEAVDKKNSSLVCVATIRDMMDNRILVHFDSWDDIYDYWADPTSPYIHPIGWCDQYGHNLTPPNDYPHPESFTWETYLKETKTVAAPVRAFKQRPACGFRRGMRLECVDKRVPQLIRVATVDDVKEHRIRIHFDGWPDRYSYWVEDDSPDIHPVGWCHKTGHPIESPLTPDDVYDFVECKTVGCRGVGHLKGPKFATHSSTKYCPYAEENIDVEKILPDRLLSPDRTLDEVVPISREPKEKSIKSKTSRPPKLKAETTDTKPQLIKQEPVEPVVKKPSKPPPKLDVQEKAISLIADSKVAPAEREVWKKHSNFLRQFVDVRSDPRKWTKHDVSAFLLELPHGRAYSESFLREDIDGDALLALSQEDILRVFKMKMGPAIKLYNCILLLRQRVQQRFGNKT